MTEEEKTLTAYHEGGHALVALHMPASDPVHKATIIPRGRALGMVMRLPERDMLSHTRSKLKADITVAMGGRVAEEIVFGHQSTGAENDLVGCTELARKMVREWGMSTRVGPMAWGSQGAVFLGEDLMHSRDYSDETARVIDEEVEHILRDEEERCRKTLEEYRAGLDSVAHALLERETLEGLEVARLVDDAMGRKVGGPRMILHADGTEEPAAEPLDDPLLTPPDL
jgi:cell division protease FtsH